MIRGAVVHMTGEQPLLADLDKLPLPGDTVLVCTNLRSTSGQRPTFIDAIASTFVIPYEQIRFVEIPIQAIGGEASGGAAEAEELPPEPELALDEDFLRRVREA